MKDATLRFILKHHVRLPRDADNWRPLEAGTYTHRQLPYGPMRDGVTNGVIAILQCGHEIEDVVEVILDNLDFVPDQKPSAYRNTAKRTRKDRPCLDPLIGETVWDSEGTRIVVGSPRLRDICRTLIANGETLRYTRPAKRSPAYA